MPGTAALHVKVKACRSRHGWWALEDVDFVLTYSDGFERVVVWDVLTLPLALRTFSRSKLMRQLVNGKYPLGIQLLDFSGANSLELAQMVHVLRLGQATVMVNADTAV